MSSVGERISVGPNTAPKFCGSILFSFECAATLFPCLARGQISKCCVPVEVGDKVEQDDAVPLGDLFNRRFQARYPRFLIQLWLAYAPISALISFILAKRVSGRTGSDLGKLVKAGEWDDRVGQLAEPHLDGARDDVDVGPLACHRQQSGKAI